MKTNIQKLPAKTYKLEIIIDKDIVNINYQKALDHLGKHVKIDGFREGFAPSSIVEDKIDQSKLNGEVVNLIVPEAVNQAIKEHHLQPIIDPKIYLKQLEKDKECILEALIVEYPEIILGDYKKAIIEFKNKDQDAKGENKVKIDNITKPLLEEAKIDISEVLIEEEVSRIFASLIDQTAKVGITVEDYLKSINKTLDQLKEDYKKSSQDNIKLDFILTEIAKAEKISIDDKDVEMAINANPDPKSREEFSKAENKWYLRSILLKNKVLSYLSNLKP